MSNAVLVGKCIHGNIMAAVVEKYAKTKDRAEITKFHAVERVDGPVTMGGGCGICYPK